MTQEEKILLLKDLCARLPYEVQVFVESDKYAPATLLGVDVKRFSIIFGGNNWSSMSKIEGNHVEQHKQLIKPYLRPLPSMTEKEKKEFEKISHCFLKTIVLKRDRKYRIVEQKAYFDNEIPSSGAFGDDGDYRYFKQEYFVNLIDWLNAHHFDYRGLIEKGLAIEAPKEMYNIK